MKLVSPEASVRVKDNMVTNSHVANGQTCRKAPNAERVARSAGTFSVPVQRMHQIEVTSHCNLRCPYCVSPNLQRPKVHMSEEHFRLALKWARKFVRMRQQDELNLSGIGEPTLHPDIVRFVALAREAVGWNCWLLFTTNGVLLDDDLCKALVKYKPSIYISAHRPEYAGPAVEAARRYGLLEKVSLDPVLNAINMAGQVDWYVSPLILAERRHCWWLRDGRVMLMADGRVTTCCLDGSGAGVIGTIEEDVSEMRMSPYKLCETCHEIVVRPKQ